MRCLIAESNKKTNPPGARGTGRILVQIGFNVRYLADALRVIPSEEVTLELTNGLSPIVLTPADNKFDFAYMVLPVRIKNG